MLWCPAGWMVAAAALGWCEQSLHQMRSGSRICIANCGIIISSSNVGTFNPIFLSCSIVECCKVVWSSLTLKIICRYWVKSCSYLLCSRLFRNWIDKLELDYCLGKESWKTYSPLLYMLHHNKPLEAWHGNKTLWELNSKEKTLYLKTFPFIFSRKGYTVHYKNLRYFITKCYHFIYPSFLCYPKSQFMFSFAKSN